MKDAAPIEPLEIQSKEIVNKRAGGISTMRTVYRVVDARGVEVVGWGQTLTRCRRIVRAGRKVL